MSSIHLRAVDVLLVDVERLREPIVLLVAGDLCGPRACEPHDPPLPAAFNLTSRHQRAALRQRLYHGFEPLSSWMA
eukprot:NODE_22740_length_696_cov_5.311072.p4 GENE.NODE_22740_length_696_cov_5.311072~~NODE_22740_length_696_cov_5.311072.p4  ORF type:complete len:76 (+),score=9.49 NODE_22740_length_696_cov_5.311072:214-441(+)